MLSFVLSSCNWGQDIGHLPIHVKHLCVRACVRVHVHVVYEDIFSVPIIQNAYKSNRVSFFGGGSLLWGLSLGVG